MTRTQCRQRARPALLPIQLRLNHSRNLLLNPFPSDLKLPRNDPPYEKPCPQFFDPVPHLLPLRLNPLPPCLKFFLHLDTAEEQRWNLIALIFSAVIILLLVGLSLWIMDSIHNNMLAH